MKISRASQHGGSLVITLVLLGAMALVIAFANRNHLFEARASLNQYRSTQAFEAAEAGLAWGIAMLNDPRALNEQCMPGAGASASLAERWQAAQRRSVKLAAACVKNTAGWTCSCASDGTPRFGNEVRTDASAFRIELTADSQAGVLQIAATGCTSLSGECLPRSRPADATAHTQVLVGMLPAVASLPLAAMTAKQSVNATGLDAGFHNPDAASGGITVHAGRGATTTSARLTTAPGGAADASVIENDPMLNDPAADSFFNAFFGLSRSMWKQQQGVKVLRCDGDCSIAIAAAVAGGHRMIWIEGDARLASDVAIGQRGRPVVLVTTGTLAVAASVNVHGLVYAGRIDWSGAPASVRGAIVSESDALIANASDFVRDAAVLNDLQSQVGSYARVPGSWRDF
jgi:Tfp pilus assembly protein PilX